MPNDLSRLIPLACLLSNCSPQMSLTVLHEYKDGQAPPEMYVISSRLVKCGTLERPSEAELKEDSYVDELQHVVHLERGAILAAISAKKRPPTVRHRFGDDMFDVCIAYYKLEAATEPHGHIRALRDIASSIESWDLFLVLHQTESRAMGDNTPEPEVAVAAVPAAAPEPAAKPKPEPKPKQARAATPRRSKRRRLT